MTVPFKELDGSPVETFGPDGPKAQRRILVAWEDRQAMIAELLGDGYQVGAAPPAGYPLCPSALAMEIRSQPWPAKSRCWFSRPTPGNCSGCCRSRRAIRWN